MNKLKKWARRQSRKFILWAFKDRVVPIQAQKLITDYEMQYEKYPPLIYVEEMIKSQIHSYLADEGFIEVAQEKSFHPPGIIFKGKMYAIRLKK